MALALFMFTWAVGLAGAGVVSVVIRSDSPRVVRAGRVALAFVFTIDVFAAAIDYTLAKKGNGSVFTTTDGGFWWAIAVGCGIPVALLSGVAVRRAFAGHRLALISAVLAMAALYLAFPLGFVPQHHALTGLGRFEHEHHAFDVLALFAPTLILLVSEALRGRVADPDEAGASLLERLRRAPRRAVVGAAIALVASVLLLGVSGTYASYAVAIAAVGLILAGWWRTRTAARRMRRGFK